MTYFNTIFITGNFSKQQLEKLFRNEIEILNDFYAKTRPSPNPLASLLLLVCYKGIRCREIYYSSHDNLNT